MCIRDRSIHEQRIVLRILEACQAELKGVKLKDYAGTKRKFEHGLWDVDAQMHRYISEKYFSMICGAQIELNFSQHGWDEYYEDYPTLSYTRTMNYVEIPFLAHLAFGKDRGLQFFIHAGPQIGFLLGDSEKIDGDWDGTVAESYTNITVEQHGKAIDNKFDYGIAGGAGIELRTKAGNFIVEGRYYYALSDFYGSTKKDFFSRSAHGVITAKITYLFDLKK